MADTYEELRPLLFSIAYRMLSSVAEAEDIVQDAFLRYHRALVEQPGAITSPKAYLSAITTRLAIDYLRSARVRRERYVGEWLPEPLLTDGAGLDGARRVEEADSVSMAFLLVLDRLSPVERAVFLLHDVFDYAYDEIARIVDKTEANCRQLAARARRHVREEKPRVEASRQKRDALAARFVDALHEGDMRGLVELLAADAAVYSDGGGRAPSFLRPITGRDRLVQLFVGLSRAWRELGCSLRRREINGQPGVMLFDDSNLLVAIWTFDIADGLVQTIRAVINPDKLHHLGPVADARALARERGERRAAHRH